MSHKYLLLKKNTLRSSNGSRGGQHHLRATRPIPGMWSARSRSRKSIFSLQMEKKQTQTLKLDLICNKIKQLSFFCSFRQIQNCIHCILVFFKDDTINQSVKNNDESDFFKQNFSNIFWFQLRHWEDLLFFCIFMNYYFDKKEKLSS